MSKRQSVSLLFWNIDGVKYKIGNASYSKLDDDENINELSQHDILLFVETHSSHKDQLDMDGYRAVKNVRPKSKTSNKFYGGLAILTKHSIRKGIKYLPITSTEFMWIKLDQTFFNIEKDLYICLAYCNPSSSSFTPPEGDIFELIENKVAEYSKLGDVLICGDFNARTNTDPDYCLFESELSEHLDMPTPFISDVPMHRSNIDKSSVDSNGKKMLDLCKSTSLRILNGRCLGDSFGSNTCYSHTGTPSTIDYMLASQRVLDNVNTFSVSNVPVDSIHCKLSLNLHTQPYNMNNEENETILNYDIPKYKWKDGDDLKVFNKFNSQQINTLIDSALNKNLEGTNESLNEIVNDITNIYKEVIGAPPAHRKTKRKTKCHSTQNKNKKWFDSQCRECKSRIRVIANKINKNPYDTQLVHDLRVLKKSYKKIIKIKKNTYEASILNQLETLQTNNPKTFWNLFNDLRDMEKSHKQNPIPADEWISHFKTLLNQPLHVDQHHQDTIDAFLNENHDIFNELNYSISDNEIIKGMRKLKTKKAVDLDGVLNEVIKRSPLKMFTLIKRVFNLILLHSIYPDNWRSNVLSPIHKKGDLLDTGNYRGIAIGSNLSKLLLSILNNRLYDFCKKNNILPNNQIGYQKGCRTTDHILVLKTIIDKYICRNSNLYVCFVDFKSAFDTVWRNALFYKLLKHDVGGNFLKLLRNMYNNVSYRVKINGGITEKIESSLGVKQGCVMSPLLFNIFLADLPSIFDDTCDPVHLNVTNLSCLMYADDLVLMSDSAMGLQNCISKLHNYCKQWNLTINHKKTQVIIFNKSGHTIKRFHFYLGDIKLSIVNEYCYLGIVFCPSGTFTTACKTLADKALKAFYALKTYDTRNNILLSLKLFDTLITPILTYGGEIWGPYFFKKFTGENIVNICDDMPLEKINIRLCKYLLGVGKKTTNNAVRGELGRFPLAIRIITQFISYWNRMQEIDYSSLAKTTYMHFLTEKRFPWFENIRNMMFFLELDNEWYKHIDYVLNDLHFLNDYNNMSVLNKKSIHTQLCEIYEKQWLEIIQKSSGKLRTYRTFKKRFCMENYVLSNCLEKRRDFTKLRISAHSLAIERDRYYKKKVEKEKRLCKLCDFSEVEDEEHFITKCTFYKSEREQLKNDLINLSGNNNLPEYFNLVMSYGHGDTEYANIICNFVKICVEKRSEYFEMCPTIDNNENVTVSTRSGRTIKVPEKLNL